MMIKVLLLMSLSSVSFADDSPSVITSTGVVIGSEESVGGRKYDRYLGIPYAEAPVGPLRFRQTVPVKPWPEPIRADHFSPACWEVYPYVYPWVDDSPGKSEDCLYLNIWVPEGASRSSPKPVMMWIYGGGFSSGSSRLPTYVGDVLATEGDVVVVSINYRIGIFGFLSTDSEEAPGNMGLFDALVALKWVNENIQAFGGDMEKITLFGQSAGGNTQAYFTVSPLTKGLFRRVIMESGVEVPLVTAGGDPKDHNTHLGQEVAEVVGCASENVTIEDSTNEVVECLRTIEAQNLVNAVYSIIQNFETFLPIYGDEFMPKKLFEAIEDGDVHVMDAMVGNVQDEGSFLITASDAEVFGPFGYKNSLIDKAYAKSLIVNNSNGYERAGEVADYFLEGVPDGKSELATRQAYYALGDFFFFCPLVYFADLLSDQQRNVFYYYFDHRSKNTVFAPWMGVTHGSEVPFVFGRPLDNANYTEEEANLSQNMMQLWTNYAYNGFPSDTWKKFTSQEQYVEVLRINGNYPNYASEQFNNCENLKEFYNFF